MDKIERIQLDECYLFRSQLNQLKHLVISSHGGQLSSDPFHRVLNKVSGKNLSFGYCQIPAGTTLHFYNAEGTLLTDPGINVMQKQEPYESVSYPKLSTDYILSKYQTKGGESYDDIIKTMKVDLQQIDFLRGVGGDETVEKMRLGIRNERKLPWDTIDVLTIRKRGGFIGSIMGVKLSRILRILQERGLKYENIHCVFCRGGNIKPNNFRRI